MSTLTASSSQAPDLVASLSKHNETFTTLLSLIPSRYYIAPTQEEADSKWMKNKKRKTGEEIKEHKRRAKHEKLDPENNKTTAEILFASNEDVIPTLTSTPTLSAEAEAGPSTQTLVLPPTIRPLPPAASISDLRAKLHSKLDGFRKDRGVDESRDALEQERRRKRGELRDNRRAKRKEEVRRSKESGSKPVPTQLIVPALPKPTSDPISFPTVALPSSKPSKPSKQFKHISNPAQALSHLEKHKEKLASLDPDKRKEVEERERWAKAEARASGEKVADETGTLKKAVKRLEKGKSKSGKEWSERKKTLEKSQATAIKKRNDNIASRVDAKRDKKFGVKGKNKDKGKKKGRPGFEGGKKGGGNPKAKGKSQSS
ncbi:surfeit locus protein 6-domain-containing protein [Naematelia encephala]|uniref:Surfeit locus protein 6-domain-containing protein n=1 Tax=Naematelia encephala TaxID=71784 RepID=A0A1Y2BM90_9TREE|nr:surfeit locus protein 6-domain-containing protein [Naematelia encephala]